MDLTNLHVNIAGSSSDNVLRDASGTFDESWGIIKTSGGTVVGAGPQAGDPQRYVVMTSQKVWKDVKCFSADNGAFEFSINPGF